MTYNPLPDGRCPRCLVDHTKECPAYARLEASATSLCAHTHAGVCRKCSRNVCLESGCTLARKVGSWCAVHAIENANTDEDAPAVCAYPGCTAEPDSGLMANGVRRTGPYVFCIDHLCIHGACPNPVARSGPNVAETRACVQHEAIKLCHETQSRDWYGPPSWKSAYESAYELTSAGLATLIPRDSARLNDLDRRVSALEAIGEMATTFSDRPSVVEKRLFCRLTRVEELLSDGTVERLRQRLVSAVAAVDRIDYLFHVAEEREAATFFKHQTMLDRLARAVFPATDVEGPAACTRCGVRHADQAVKRRHMLTWLGRLWCTIRRAGKWRPWKRRNVGEDARTLVVAAEAVTRGA